jgi:hypothetical protein
MVQHGLLLKQLHLWPRYAATWQRHSSVLLLAVQGTVVLQAFVPVTYAHVLMCDSGGRLP